MQTAYVIDAVRTPFGRYGGKLSAIRADDLLALAIKTLLERNPSVPPDFIEDIIAGAANQAGEDCRNIARMAALLAGLPVTVPGNTVNRLCGSGLQSIIDAARGIMCGDGMLYIAGGVDNMTRSPFVIAKTETAWGRKTEMVDSTIGWRFTNPKLAAMYPAYSMGETAENIAKEWKISREEQDRYAFASHQKYHIALEKGIWNDEVIPVPLSDNIKSAVFTQDEYPRKLSLEKLASLKPVFVKDGTVTAGNSSGINDGAAAVLMANEAAIKQFHLKPLARIVSTGISAVHPSFMGIAPVSATQKALQKSGLTIKDIGLIEMDEAFASQSLACIRDLGLDEKITNINGGSIAIGHPLGCCGTRIVTTLVHEMKRRKCKYGLATISIGLGQGASVIFEKV